MMYVICVQRSTLQLRAMDRAELFVGCCYGSSSELGLAVGSFLIA